MSLEIQPNGASLSADGKYRWRLWRTWDLSLPVVCFIMLNPSTADAITNDATIRKCIAIAKLFGYGGIIVVNLFALRATNPKELLTARDPVGEENDHHILTAVREVGGSNIFFAWGKLHQKLQSRATAVLRLLRQAGIDAGAALHRNKDGSPGHPLYLPLSDYCFLYPT